MREIFVFGSNREGRHGKGAALTARLKHGAINGQAEGLQGDSYAIITKELRKACAPVTLKEIQNGVAAFISFAECHPNWQFNVTDIGCGLAKFTPKLIAPLFANRSANVLISKRFQDVL